MIRLRGRTGWSESMLVAIALCWFCRDAAHLLWRQLIHYVLILDATHCCNLLLTNITFNIFHNTNMLAHRKNHTPV
jgi:hypothetical protein